MQPVQLSATAFHRRDSIASPRQAFKAAPLQGDTVQFASANKPLTDAEKLAKAQQEALQLFLTPEGKPKSRAEIVQGIQEHFQGTVEVFDGSQTGNEWVNKTLEKLSNRGMFNTPDSLLYPEDSRSTEAYINDHNCYPQDYIDTCNRLQDEKHCGLYIHKDAPLSTLMHETFHALQFTNDLPMGASSFAVQIQSNQFRDAYNISSGIGCLIQPFKRALTWITEIPYLLLTRGLPSAEKDQAGDTAGKALRNEMRREMEVDKFLLANGPKLGLTVPDYLSNAAHFVLESSLQYFRSLWLD